MSTKRLLSALIMLFAVFCVAVAQQPYGGCWHPDNIKDWSPEKDPDAKFNRSTVPLQPRFLDTSIKANANQHAEGKVAACLTMNPMCSQTPSQGADNFIGYNPTYWQYMDLLIWWGGSAGEGIIIPPSAPVTDIAHLNGVKVLGQLFFPPGAFGGQVEWVKQMLTNEGGTYPYAKKMYEIAAYYGFDGWFVNEETGGGSSSEWTAWVDYFNQCAQEGGHPEMEIQWYDCGTSIGGYGDMMKLHNTSYFLNYGSPSSSNISSQMAAMEGLGFSKEECFSKLYFGIEVAQGGMNGNASYFKNLFPADKHNGSIDLFNPEEPIWKEVVKDYLGTTDACGTKAYTAMDKVFSNESRYWTNEQHDPSNTTARDGGYFPGFANALIERSTIQNLPFITSFSAGLGKHRFVNGEKKGTQDWYHRGMQDIMPTWRWWVDVAADRKSDLAFSLNWDDAYNMGTSINVKGTLAANVDYLTRLYKTKLSISNGDKLQLVFKGATASTIQVKLGVAENNNEFTTFNLGSTTTSNGWNVATVDLSSLAGKTVSVIALNFKSATQQAYELTLGQLGILPANYAPASTQISNLTILNELTQDGGDIRAVWDASASKDVHHYNVYMTRNGEKKLVGQTRNEGFYISKFARTSIEEKSVTVAVTAVTNDLKEGNEITTIVEYPALDKPVVSLKASKTLLNAGEEITIIANATNFPESYQWTIPENAEKVSQEDNTLTLKFNKEGVYNITVAVSNSEGTTEKTVQNLIEVSDAKAGALSIISVGKTIHSASGSLPPEDPENLIDGVEVPGSTRDKWCIGGKKEHWVIIDLEKSYQIYRFRVFDCGHKENYSDNFKNFKIWVSNDAETWTEPVVDEKGRPENTKDDYIAPIVGRYVKFMPYDEDAPITIRIWEFEVFGLEGGPLFSLPADKTMDINATEDIEIKYDLNGDEEADNFGVKVSSDNEDIAAISDFNVNKATQTVTFKLTAKKMGAANISVKMTNGEWENEKKCKVEVEDPAYTNVLSGKTASASYWYYGSTWQSADTQVLTDNDLSTTWDALCYTSGENVIITFDCGEIYNFAKVAFKAQQIASDIKVYIGIKNSDDSYELAANYTPTSEVSSVITNDIFGRYLKLVVTAPAYTYFKVAEIEAYGKLYEGELPEEPIFASINISSGFNVDVVAEATPVSGLFSDGLDDQGWILYGANVQAEGSLPANGAVTSKNGIEYQLADYAQNNAALMKEANSATLEFETEQRANSLYFLGISANGTSTVSVTANYTDGTSASAGNITIGDWFGSNESTVGFYGLGRVGTGITSEAVADKIDARYQFRLFECPVQVDPAKKVQSVTLNKVSGGYPAIFAVAKKEIPVGTGIENNIESGKNGLNIYPSPVRNGETLYVESADARLIQLVTMQGAILLQTQATENVTELPINGIAQGIYLLIVTGNDGSQTAKVVVK